MPTAPTAAPVFEAIAPDAAGMPLYRAVKRALLGAIETGRCAPGEILPSETEIAGAMGVSIGTLRRAVDELTAEHLLVRRQGRGTFVATHSTERFLFQFFQLEREDGLRDAPRVDLVSFARVRAPAEAARALALPTGEPVIEIENSLHLQGRPVISDRMTLPAALFKGLTEKRVRERPGTLYQLFQAEFGIPVLQARERARVATADRHAARVLGLAPGAPVMQVRRTALSFDDRPIEYRVSVIDTSRHEYVTPPVNERMSTMIDLLKASRAAEQAAYAAGTHLQASRSRLSAVVLTHQSPEAVVEAIDAEAQALIREVVLKQFPEHGFVGTQGSEADRHIAALSESRPHWIVDALDGSANYLRGYPQYAVSIALVERGKAVVGVVYDPVRNEFFGAIRGHGAVLNGLKIRCAAARPPLESLAATVFPKPSTPLMADYIAEFGRVLRGFGGVRRSGSMVLELAYLAAGRIDGFWAHDVGPWDAAAGIVLLRESRALIEARDGLPLLESRSLMACTKALREPLGELLGAVSVAA